MRNKENRQRWIDSLEVGSEVVVIGDHRDYVDQITRIERDLGIIEVGDLRLDFNGETRVDTWGSIYIEPATPALYEYVERWGHLKRMQPTPDSFLALATAPINLLRHLATL